MKETTFFILIGFLSGVSLTCGLLGWHFARMRENKEKSVDGSSFKETFADNAPKSDDSSIPDYESDWTDDFRKFY